MQTQRTTVAVRLADGDAAGLTATVTLVHGDQTDTLRLHSGHPADEWMYDVAPDEQSEGRVGFSYVVEYEWGWARERTARGEADAGPLVLPLPGVCGDSTFPFPGRF